MATPEPYPPTAGLLLLDVKPMTYNQLPTRAELMNLFRRAYSSPSLKTLEYQVLIAGLQGQPCQSHRKAKLQFLHHPKKEKGHRDRLKLRQFLRQQNPKQHSLFLQQKRSEKLTPPSKMIPRSVRISKKVFRKKERNMSHEV